MIDIERARATTAAAARPHYHGLVRNVSGQLIEVSGLPAAIGELVHIDQPGGRTIPAEVVGFRADSTLVMPHGPPEGVAPRQRVLTTGRALDVPVGLELLGRAVDGFGLPIDQLGPIRSGLRRPVHAAAPSALGRQPINQILETGVRAIDAAATLGRGQRLGIFAGSGVGKSTLLGQIVSGCTADAIVVCLVGERGREVGSFIDSVLGPEGRARSTVVVATSDRPPIERYTAPFTAVTVAEELRDSGRDVLLVMDSITRFAAASREIGLAAGEPPTLRGYPPRFFSTVPRLVERMGNSDKGSITGLITVLVDGDDPNEPVADTLRGLLDGHIFLDRDLAERGWFPAIDVLGSLSRLMPDLASPLELDLTNALRADLAAWREGKDLVELGAHKPGANPALDGALERLPMIEAFLRQSRDDRTSRADSFAFLANLYGAAAPIEVR